MTLGPGVAAELGAAGTGVGSGSAAFGTATGSGSTAALAKRGSTIGRRSPVTPRMRKKVGTSASTRAAIGQAHESRAA